MGSKTVRYKAVAIIIIAAAIFLPTKYMYNTDPNVKVAVDATFEDMTYTLTELGILKGNN